MLRVPDDYDANWCPDCGEPRGVCRCDELQDEIDEETWEDDGEPDFTLDELEWDERYPELSEDEELE